MKDITQNLLGTLDTVLPFLQNLSDEETSIKPSPQKWSKKEILGHLIDSACNNQQKFVRTISESGISFIGYQQNSWVESQKYNSVSWQNLVNFWQTYNLHIAHIIENVSDENLSNTITIQDGGTFTLEFIMLDYVEHLKHHLNQILPILSLKSDFQNIYNT